MDGLSIWNLPVGWWVVIVLRGRLSAVCGPPQKAGGGWNERVAGASMLIGLPGQPRFAPTFARGYSRVVRNFYGGMRVRPTSRTPTRLDATRSSATVPSNRGEEYLNPAPCHLATTILWSE